MHYIMVRLPFCFILWIFEHNTAVTIPKTVTVATHSATKEAVVAMKTPEEWEQRSTPAGDNVSCYIGELIVSRYVADSITMIAGRFGHVGLCQLHTVYTYIHTVYQYNYTYVCTSGQMWDLYTVSSVGN